MTKKEFAAMEADYFKQSLSLLKQDVAVRVESRTDVSFWAKVFRQAVPHLKIRFFTQSQQNSTKSKEAALSVSDFTDEQLVVCIDSDYDYLLDSPHLKKPFVFQTYLYSIENYWSLAEGLQEVIKKATDTEGIDFDFETYFKTYSEGIFDCLAYSLFLTKQGNSSFSATKCGHLAVFHENLKEPFADLSKLLEKVQQEIKDLKIHNGRFTAFTEGILKSKLQPRDAYQFVRGHDIFDGLTLRLVKFLGQPIQDRRFEEFRKNGDKVAAANYHKYKKDNTFDKLLRHNPAIETNAYFQRILSDIKTAFAV